MGESERDGESFEAPARNMSATDELGAERISRGYGCIKVGDCVCEYWP